MAWISKGESVATAAAELAAERGETAVLEAQSTVTLVRARTWLLVLARRNPEKFSPAAERIRVVLEQRGPDGRRPGHALGCPQ